ncbi:UNVERIFIED_CONTAM: hypothetical protein K2H54_038563 [Gekko kuhli]
MQRVIWLEYGSNVYQSQCRGVFQRRPVMCMLLVLGVLLHCFCIVATEVKWLQLEDKEVSTCSICRRPQVLSPVSPGSDVMCEKDLPETLESSCRSDQSNLYSR